jgi:hypothetical protein
LANGCNLPRGRGGFLVVGGDEDVAFGDRLRKNVVFDSCGQRLFLNEDQEACRRLALRVFSGVIETLYMLA